jgi:hypothetical protein
MLLGSLNQKRIETDKACSTGQKRKVYRVSFGKVQGKRSRERPDGSTTSKQSQRNTERGGIDCICRA